MNYIGVIWNTTYNSSDEIKKIIQKYGIIRKEVTLDLSKERLCDFIRALYNYGKDEKWKEDYKINDLSVYNDTKICVLDLEIDDKEFIKNKKGITVLKKAQEMKDEIRKKFDFTTINGFKEKIYSENAFHLTDNEEEYEFQKNVLQTFNQYNYVDDLESAKYYDALPRFSKEVYRYLKKKGVYNSTIADIGSGTGRIAIDLLEEGNEVYAVDPDNNMRIICEKKCKHFKNKFHSINGTDINTNLPPKSVDYIIVTQSFHRFNPLLFREEAKRVLKKPDNVFIIWYRVNFENPIYAKMLKAIKKNYLDYQTRYDTDEIIGAKLEEDGNNQSVREFFNNYSNMDTIISKSKLTLEEFLNLGLSLAIFPIVHKMNNVSEVLKQESFNKTTYIADLTNIFNQHSKHGKVELEFSVQIHSKG